MNSAGVKSLLQDGVSHDYSTYQSKSSTKNIARKRTKYTQTEPSKPWVNPNGYTASGPPKKFHFSLNHNSCESKVSKKAPFAPRSFNLGSGIDENGSNKLHYSSLEDPHLRDYFARKLGVKPKLSDGKGLKKTGQQRIKEPPISYGVIVRTGDKKNAHTDANVFIQLRGSLGKHERQHLFKEANGFDTFVFKQGSSENFTFKAKDVGDLISVDIEHDGVERRSDWYLDEVLIQNLKSKKIWRFPCHNWLSQYVGDCQTKRTLKPLKEADLPQRVIYEIEVVTGDIRGAGTDAHVYLTMFGDIEPTRRVQLVNRNINTFERNQTDVFKIKVKHLGKISKILIEHDNSGFAPGWYLDKVIITNTANPKEKYYFVCNKWLSKDDDDGQISRMLLGTKSLDNLATAHKYFISTITGDKRGAGTDANVFITLFSKSGSTSEIKLNDSNNNFERNRTDTFAVEYPSIGDLTRVRIRHDNKGLAAGWYLEKVMVKDGENKTFEFPCKRWLSTSEDDGQISRELYLYSEDGSLLPPGILYNVHITTGDIRGAGSSAEVYIILHGGKKGEIDSGKLWLRNGKDDNFKRGRTILFTVECSNEMSPFDHVTIGHDNSGMGPGWYLEKVVVDAPTTGIEQTFFCRQWLATDEGDGLIERNLFEAKDFRKEKEISHTWNASVYTSDIRGAGTDANVFIVLYGNKGKSEQMSLTNETNNFERGNVDNFKLNIKDVGSLYKVRVWHDNLKLYADWHLDKVILQNCISNEKYTFFCNEWLSDENEYIVELPMDGEAALPVIPYEVTVYTGDKWGAGTDANVFINIFGKNGDTGERPLRKSSENRNKFERKNEDKFIIKAVHLMDLMSIRIGHDGRQAGDGWFLDKVIVYDPLNDECFPFACSRWFAVNEDDGMIVRDLSVGDTSTLLKTTSYHVTVKTGDKRGAGTNANVYIILFGDDGDTGKLLLKQSNNTSNKWERGRSDMFTLEATDIGKVTKLIIGHDGAGLGAGWYLESVFIDVPSTGQHLRFSCNRWLATDEDDGKIERELYPSDDQTHEKKIPYEVEVHTGDVYGAGTNANVFVVLYGESKKSEEFWLRNKTDNFERKEVDKFKVECDDVGSLKKLRVGHDNAGFGAAWFLDKIIIRRLNHKGEAMETKDSSSNNEEIFTYVFPCGRWFSKSEDDGEIIRELMPYDTSGNPLVENMSDSIYTVHVFTGDMKGSGTNANVFCTIYGEQGDTGERQLKKSETHFDKFERNQEDVFTIKALDLGKLKKVKIRHDNDGLQPSWYLEKITIDKENEETYLFPCDRWLSKSEDDGALSRELVPVHAAEYERRKSRALLRKQSSRKSKSMSGDVVDLEEKAEKTTYNVHVTTGHVSGAGTDANVYIVLYGENDDSGKVELKTSKNNSNKFERNQLDEFTVEAVELGSLKKIRIGHDNKGGFAGWFLDNVVIDAPSLGKKWFFPAGRWLDKDKDDGKLEVDLYPSEHREKNYEKCVPYEIVVYTSDLSGAGTDSNVFIALYGFGGACTDEVFLTDSKKKRKECFNRGSVDVFVRELRDVGDQIDKVRIGHDNKGFGAAWHLDKVEVRRLIQTESGEENSSGSITFTFPCNRWFSKREDDGQIVRELIPSNVVEESFDEHGRVSVVEHRIDALQVHDYKIHVFTGDIKKAGTDANVFITLFGENGDSGERQLMKSETHRDKFERANEDIFSFQAADLGSISKILIRHDDSNLGSDWYLDRVEVLDVTENRKYIFTCERWLAKNRDDGKIKRVLYEKNYEGDRGSTVSSAGSLASLRNTSTMSLKSASSMRSSSADKVFENEVKGKMKRSVSKKSIGSASLKSVLETIPYTVSIATGDKQEHETTANVFIVFIGTDVVSEKIPLDLNEKSKFEAGSIETFNVEAEDVGDIKKIEVSHDGYKVSDSWYVKYIDIDVPLTGSKYHFPCEFWLGKDKEDGKTERIVSADERKDVQYKPKVPYQLTVCTGDVKNAGTDGEITISLFGNKGKSEEIKLEKQETSFERGSVDVIRLNIEEIGEPTKIRVSHNGKGSRAEWFLDKMVLLNLMDESITTFPCNTWFSKSLGDKKLIRELPAVAEGLEQIEETSYEVTVVTGNKSGCGTDANVYLIIFGENGDSGELPLKESTTNKDKFERGQTDIFNFNMLNLGKLTKIRIWHDNKYLRAGWFLSHVVIVDQSDNTPYHFPCERWLAKDEDDGSLIRELPCANKTPSAKEKGPLSGYEVTFITSDKPNAGTVQSLLLTLVDINKNMSDELLIENSSKKKILRRGQTDTVKVVSHPLEEIKYIMLEMKPNKKSQDESLKWHVAEIIIKDISQDIKYTFEVNDWIKYSPNNPNNTVQIEATDTEKSRVEKVRELQPIKYILRTFTADVSGAGTDANVFVTIFGENGDSGKRQLKKSMSHMDKFERGNMDDFNLEILDLGDLTKLHIEHDNKGFGAGWNLDRVEIENTSTKKITQFPCQQWLNKTKGDKKIFRELHPT